MVFGQIAEPGVESPEGKVLSEDGDVSERQFYRPGSHIRPSYNHGLNAGPIRPGHYNSINYGSAPAAHRPYNRPFNAVRPPNHIYNNGHHRKFHCFHRLLPVTILLRNLLQITLALTGRLASITTFLRFRSTTCKITN